VQLFQQSVGHDHRDTLQAQSNLAMAYAESGRLDEAEPLFEQTLTARRRALGDGDTDTLLSINNLGMLYQTTNRFSRALPLLQEAVQAYQDQGVTDDQALSARNNLGLALQQHGRAAEALPHFEAVLAERQRVLGIEHPNTLASMVNLSSAYRDIGRLEEAVKLAEEARRQAIASLTVEHPVTLAAMNNLLATYSAAARFDDAAPIGAETLRLVESRLGSAHPNTQKVRLTLAVVHLRCGRGDEAVQLAEKARVNLPPGSRDLEAACQILGEASLMTNKTETAIEVLQAAIAAHPPGDDSPDGVWTRCLLGAALSAAGRFEDAERLLLEGRRWLVSPPFPLPESQRRAVWLLEQLVQLYARWEKPGEQARWQQQLDAMRNRLHGCQ